MYLHFFGLILCLVVAVNGEPKPDPKAQMAIVMPGGRNFGYQNWYLRPRPYRRQFEDYPDDWDVSPPFFPDRRMFG